VLKYTEPAKPMSGEGPTQVTTTNRDYDLAETSKAIRSVLMGCLFVRRAPAPFGLSCVLRACTRLIRSCGRAQMAGMHLYMKYTQPLFIQGIMPLKALYDSKVRPLLSLPPPWPLRRTL